MGRELAGLGFDLFRWVLLDNALLGWYLLFYYLVLSGFCLRVRRPVLRWRQAPPIIHPRVTPAFGAERR